MTQEALKLGLEELANRFSEGWHEGIKIDASDIMLLSEAAEALSQPEQEPPKYSFKAYWEIDGRIGVVACIERPDGGVHLMSEILDLPSSTEPQYTFEHQARIAAFKDAMSTTKEKNT